MCRQRWLGGVKRSTFTNVTKVYLQRLLVLIGAVNEKIRYCLQRGSCGRRNGVCRQCSDPQRRAYLKLLLPCALLALLAALHHSRIGPAVIPASDKTHLRLCNRQRFDPLLLPAKTAASDRQENCIASRRHAPTQQDETGAGWAFHAILISLVNVSETKSTVAMLFFR